MAKFKFTLEPLLKVRRHAEQAHQRAVSQLEIQRMQIEDQLRRQQASISDGRDSLRSGLTGRVDVHSLRLHAGASMQMMRAALRLVLELAGVHKRLEAARAGLIEATKQRRAMELLHDRQLARFKAAIERRETAALDEMAVIAAARADLADNNSTEIGS
jgi:flagellar FliJ protein